MSQSPVQNGQFNLGHICTRQQCEAGRSNRLAFRWISPQLERKDYTFLDLEKLSNRAANALLALGVQPGDRVFIFLPKCPEVYYAALGIWKIRAIAGILFANFGEDALFDRLGDSQARVLITKKSLFRKVRPILSKLPHLEKILLIDIEDMDALGNLSFSALLEQAQDTYDTPLTPANTPSVLHYTSGSTGKPKGVLHIHQSILSQAATFRALFNPQEEDVYWCTADPGWVTGVSYGILGPWSQGTTQIHFGGNYDPGHWFSILEQERVHLWYTAPTAMRMLMREDPQFYAKFDLSALRHIFSVGEPLNPVIVDWTRRVLNKDIHDTWFQTETGAIMISNRPGLPIKPGSMGKPVERIEAAILDPDDQPLPACQQGRLCVKTGWPSMFITYLNNETLYQKKFHNGYYDSGDMAYCDEDGYFWFVGRGDDVINTAGHLVSPFEVESALMEVNEVSEAAVIAAPDEILFEKVVAYLRLKTDVAWSPELELKIRLHVSNRVSSIATPQEIRIVDSIPKNKSGKILRRVIKAWYTGAPVGDISTLEETA